ncbi:hypothetical protein [Moraxella cuniculi]|uniref:Uncharacterized protein n=1 Tax=Moraxella cuniculi TaxID=34061 RepID=A0A3S4QP96_9GAMM|nr:hypothetical protein [Moraxella cuniculi]VEG12926.1 Uncharacterised protein [Moraxella cuniculi]
MGKLGNLAYNIGTSLNKEDISTHRQGITPTAQTKATLDQQTQNLLKAQDQALLDANQEQLKGEKESGDGIYNAPMTTKRGQLITERHNKECNQLGIPANQCGKYHGDKSLETLKEVGLFIVPTTPEEIALAVVTGGAGRYVIKAGGKVISKVFKSKDEAEKVVAEAKRISKKDTPNGYEPDNNLLGSPASGRREYYNFNLMSKTEAEEIATKISVRSPVKIPNNATKKIDQKSGYAQIKYTWIENGVKYESRWHTRTPGAPANQTNSWVVTRKVQGSRTQKAGDTEYLLNNGQWVSESKWNHALKLRKQGKETKESREILDGGHIKDVE